MSCESQIADLTGITVIAGDPFVFVNEYTQDSGPIDLTGATAELKAQMDTDSLTYDVSLTESSGLVINGPAGTITATIPTTSLSGRVLFRLTVTIGSDPDSFQGVFFVTERI